MSEPCSPKENPSVATFHPPRLPNLVTGLAPLLWLPQAGLLAWTVQRLSRGEGMAAVVGPAGCILLLGALRAMAEAFAAARCWLSASRADVGMRLWALLPSDRGRPASGLAASVIAEEAEAVVPFLVRFQPARWRATVVPLAILPVTRSRRGWQQRSRSWPLPDAWFADDSSHAGLWLVPGAGLRARRWRCSAHLSEDTA